MSYRLFLYSASIKIYINSNISSNKHMLCTPAQLNRSNTRGRNNYCNNYHSLTSRPVSLCKYTYNFHYYNHVSPCHPELLVAHRLALHICLDIYDCNLDKRRIVIAITILEILICDSLFFNFFNFCG